MKIDLLSVQIQRLHTQHPISYLISSAFNSWENMATYKMTITGYFILKYEISKLQCFNITLRFFFSLLIQQSTISLWQRAYLLCSGFICTWMCLCSSYAILLLGVYIWSIQWICHNINPLLTPESQTTNSDVPNYDLLGRELMRDSR